jgi:hypothetical protein
VKVVNRRESGKVVKRRESGKVVKRRESGKVVKRRAAGKVVKRREAGKASNVALERQQACFFLARSQVAVLLVKPVFITMTIVLFSTSVHTLDFESQIIIPANNIDNQINATIIVY